MAYESKNLSVLAYANGFTLWHYATTDAAADVDTAGYFDAAGDMLRVGDMVLANADTDGAPVSGILLVNANAGGTVDVGDLAPVGAGAAGKVHLSLQVPDLAAAASRFAVSPVAGTVTAVRSVLEGAVDVDTTLTAKIGGVAVTGGAITIAASGSAAGVVDSASPTAGNAVSAGTAIEIACGGEGAVASAATVVVEITPLGDTD